MPSDFVKMLIGGITLGGAITLLSSTRLRELKPYYCGFYNDEIDYDQKNNDKTDYSSTRQSRNMPPSYINDNNIEFKKH